jgi:hypothetical protein
MNAAYTYGAPIAIDTEDTTPRPDEKRPQPLGNRQNRTLRND